MLSPSEFQASLDRLATEIGEETLGLYDENFGRDWPNEEATTGALLGAVALSAKHRAEALDDLGMGGVSLRAKLTQKHEEKEHGGDAVIRFSCQDELWSISTSTLIQAKRHDRSRPFKDYPRLSSQLAAMLRLTPESFVMIYSRGEGIQLVPALAARSLGSQDLFDLTTLPWPRFLSGIFLGHFGEPVLSRAPYEHGDWKPMWVLEIEAEMTRFAPLTAGARAG